MKLVKKYVLVEVVERVEDNGEISKSNVLSKEEEVISVEEYSEFLQWELKRNTWLGD